MVGTALSTNAARVLLLGAGELGKEVVIGSQRVADLDGTRERAARVARAVVTRAP